MRSALIALLLVACSTTLERGLTESQADEIVVTLGEHGIGATKDPEPGTDEFRITVTTPDVASALVVLREADLPSSDAPGMAEAYATPSLVPTAGEERARMSAALAADLARSIEAMRGVHDARVHLGLPDPSVIPMDDAPSVAVASVLVRTNADVDEAGIRALVAGAVPGLAVERVTVVATPMPDESHVAPLVTVGPLYVTEGSAFGLRAILGAMLAVNVALAAVALVVVRRRR